MIKRMLVALMFCAAVGLCSSAGDCAHPRRILFLMTSATERTLRDESKQPTGFWAEEFAEPYARFLEYAEVDVASLGGRPSQPDPVSLDYAVAYAHDTKLTADDMDRYAQTLASVKDKLDHPLVLESITPEQLRNYQAVFIPGGHAPMEDLANAPAVGRLIEDAYRGHILVAAVCHGAGPLLMAHGENGQWLYDGYHVTGYSNDEENTSSPDARGLPFYLEDALAAAGGQYSCATDMWYPHVVEDRDLITGQNPASSAPIAKRVLLHLSLRRIIW